MFAPIALPEFDLPAISWAMCRNPMCANFGIHFNPRNPPVPKAAIYSDTHYRISLSTGQMRCKYCGQTSTLKSNEAIRAVARYYLSLSLPFATCSEESCPNFGVNIFESYARVGSPYPRHYRRELETRVRCPECESVKTIGARLGISDNAKTRRTIQDIVSNQYKGTKKRRTVHFDKMGSGTYYRRLHRLGARLQDHHAWLNAKLWNPDAKVDFSQVAVVQTDVVDISLRRYGDVFKSRLHKFIVSVLAFKRTFYVLAAHPFFLPAKFCPPPDEDYYDPKTGWPSKEFARKWACLEHPVHNRFLRTSSATLGQQADVSRYGEGFHIQAGYAELAHFLVVRKMLRRFKRACFYLDSAKGLGPSAMVALGDEIRTGNVDVVLFQRKYKDRAVAGMRLPDMGALGTEKRRAALRTAWDETEKRVQRKIEEAIATQAAKDVPCDPDRVAARVLKNATVGAFSKNGAWAWLRFPAPLGKEKECRSLWLTRRPGKTFEEGEDALVNSTIQRVDSAIGAFRKRVRSVGRPGTTSGSQRDFTGNYVDPKTVLSEVSIYLLGRNYTLLAADQNTIPACELGLMGAPRKPLDLRGLAAIFWRFRLGLSHAEEISKWLRQ